MALLMVQLRVGLESSGRRVGVFVREVAGRLEVTEVAPASPAERAGLSAGDVLLQVGGVPVANTSDYNRVARGFQGYTRSTISSGGRARARGDGHAGNAVRLGRLLLAALTTLAFLGVGLLAFRRRSADLRAACCSFSPRP